MKNSSYFAAILMLAFPAVCLSQVTEGKYVGWSAGQSMTKFDTSNNAFGVPNLSETYDKSESAFKFFAGYSFNKTWALEAGYAGLGTPKIDYTGSGIFANTVGRASIKNTAWYLSGKGTLPITSSVGVFAKLGMTGNKSDFTASTNSAAVNTLAGFPIAKTKVRTGPVVGIGIEYRLSEKFSLRAEFEDFGKFNNDMDAGHTSMSLWSIGSTYSF